MRIGNGYDVHAFATDRRLILGGVDIPHTMGLLGHSDADVLVHAIMDALLGAAAMGDIGYQFPDSDVQYKGISSLVLLDRVRQMLDAEGYGIGNIDSIIAAQQPKLAPYIEEMRRNIAQTLQVEISQISIKATTTEKLGFVGRLEGIEAHAVCLLVDQK
ncbi:MAG: 2-C-methyl-D-erythritol 2,4-cyclodiphosphate synthase [Tissierellia bacterium]|nr:2-C-methyl-D-erythritol 2,4-cyclodiphosphate synthase [Tissierellia bacterium]